MKKAMKFEEALSSLEENIGKLERGEIGLDDAIALYEESVSLIKFCSETLKKAEQKVTALVKTGDGEVREEEFPGAGNEL